MEKSDDIKELLTALAKAQSSLKAVAFDSTNPHFKSKYASLASFQEATRSALTTNGLSVLQLIESDEHGHYVRTVLGHSTGQWIASKFKLLITKQDMQGLGAAITYAKRQGLSAMVNVSGDEDDDGNHAVNKEPPIPHWPPEPKPPVQAKPKNVAPGMDVTHDFLQELESYKVPFGRKYLGKTLLEVGLKSAKDYVAWLKSNAQPGKPISNDAQKLFEMVEMLEHYEMEKEANQSGQARFDAQEPWPENP